jgi:kynurenine formamidase
MRLTLPRLFGGYKAVLEQPIDISIPLKFNGPQPNAYGVETAASKPYETGSLVGDTRRGGSCNFEQYTFIPHCNGTHTECVGHITHERIAVVDCLKDVLIPAVLISVEPEIASETKETYSVKLVDSDKLITRAAFQTKGSNIESGTALIIRTLPNDDNKLTRQYNDAIPPFFSTEAMEYIAGLGVKHLLVDLPSIDRLYDEGKLSNHRIFWDIEQGSFETNAATRLRHTITELIYVPDIINDGEYLLNLQIAPFAADAAPSRPVLFQLKSS